MKAERKWVDSMKDTININLSNVSNINAYLDNINIIDIKNSLSNINLINCENKYFEVNFYLTDEEFELIKNLIITLKYVKDLRNVTVNGLKNILMTNI